MHTAHHHHLGIRLCSLTGQCQRVAYKVGYLLNIADGIVVSQDNGILLLAHPSDLCLQVYAFGYGLINESLFFPLLFQHHNIILFSFFLF